MSLELLQKELTTEFLDSHSFIAKQDPFDICKATSKIFIDYALRHGAADVSMVRVRGSKIPFPNADKRWFKIGPVSCYVHYVVKIGDNIIDYTRRQFDLKAPMPFIQNYRDFINDWDNFIVEPGGKIFDF